MHTTFLLLGSNLGDKVALLQQARELLGQHVGRIVQASSLYESEPWGFDSLDWFLNQAVLLETSLEPAALLAITQQIEKMLGRTRKSNNSYVSRTIDIDILFYDNQCVTTNKLVIPHPRLHERSFVLQPLCEIAAEWQHPVFAKTIHVMLAECTDKSVVRMLV